MGGNSAAKAANREAKAARKAEEERQERIKTGTQRINKTFNGQFNDAYYRGVGDAYSEYATPQLQTQHSDARQQMIYDLSRTGKIDSSTSATQQAKLQDQYNQRNREIADKALAQQNAARGSVEDARAALISQLNATGDAQGAINAATARAAALSRPAVANEPLADLFADFTGSLSSRLAHERAFSASGGASHAYNPIVGARPGAVTVRG